MFSRQDGATCLPGETTGREQPMRAKALCTIKDGNGWHMPGEIFETDADLGNLVEPVETVEAKAPVDEAEETPKAKNRRKKTEA